MQSLITDVQLHLIYAVLVPSQEPLEFHSLLGLMAISSEKLPDSECHVYVILQFETTLQRSPVVANSSQF